MELDSTLSDSVLLEENLSEAHPFAVLDEDGIAVRYFRRNFSLNLEPSISRVWITADDDYDLYVNGRYIAADNQDEIDWDVVNDYDIKEYLSIGQNVIGIKVTDVDQSGYGLLVGMEIKTIEDIDQKLSEIVKDETSRQDMERYEDITQEEIDKMRIVEKNKLR